MILLLWAVCMAWTVGYSWLFGYGEQTGEISLVFGLPSWVFWGVAVPWTAAGVASIVFAVFFMADDDLGEDSAADAVSRGEDDAA